MRFTTTSPTRCAGLLVNLAITACGPEAVADRGETVQSLPAAATISVEEYRERRARLMEALPEGITLLHARPDEKRMEEWGFVQDPSFFYFTGLWNLPGAILAMDAPAGESHLFVPPAPESFGFPVEGLAPAPGPESAAELGVTAVHEWTGFGEWVDGRVAAGVGVLYVDEPRQPESTGVPPGLGRTAGSLGLWRSVVEARFRSADIRSAKSEIHALRWVKSPSEIEALRANAQATATAVEAAAASLAPGVRQREAEAAVVSACIESGAQGPSFWPWVMSGPNAHVTRIVESFFRYDHLDRVMEAGELVRVDLGCTGSHYGGDVGRTLPVSGRFTPGQAEAWNLLVAGYEAGLEAMADGVPVEEVREASVRAVSDLAEGLSTETGRAAAEAILDGGPGVWHIHGVGIASGEDAAAVLSAGAVVAYEPGISVGPDAYYLEDMILITDTGHEVLSAGLPRSSGGIEAMMSRLASATR